MMIPVTDIHSHVLPCVDDGAPDWNTALLMLYRAKEQGAKAVFATPHSEDVIRRGRFLWDTLAGLRGMAKNYGIDVEVYPGCEVYCAGGAMKEARQGLREGWLPTLNNTNYVLLEFSPRGDRDYVLACVKTFLEDDYIPVIAHIERYPYLEGDMDTVDELLSLGCLLQVNTYCLTDPLKPHRMEWARRLVLEGKIHFLGSDAHNCDTRPHRLAGPLAWLKDNLPADELTRLCTGNAETYLGVGRKAGGIPLLECDSFNISQRIFSLEGIVNRGDRLALRLWEESWGEQLMFCAEKAKKNGFIPVIHRINDYIHLEPEDIGKLRCLGAKLMMDGRDALSAGRNSWEQELLNQKWIDLLTDAAPGSAVYEQLLDRCPRDYLDKICHENFAG